MTIHLNSKDNVLADFLSRKSIKYKQSAAEQATVNVMFIEEDLGKVLQFTQQGWPNNLEPVFQPYYSKRLELCHEDGILLWNSRAVVPESLQGLLLADLHAEDLGMVKMKQLAPKYFGALDLISKLRRQLNYVLLVKNLLNRQHPPQLLHGPGQADHGNDYM